MKNIAKGASEKLYNNYLQPGLEAEYKRLLIGVGHIPEPARTEEDAKKNEIDESITGDYAEEVLLNLIQYMTNGVSEINTLIMEDFHNPAVVFASFEESFEKIRRLHSQSLDLQSDVAPRKNIFDSVKIELEAKQKAKFAQQSAMRAKRDADEAKNLLERTTKTVMEIEAEQRNKLEEKRLAVLQTKEAIAKTTQAKLELERAKEDTWQAEEHERQTRKLAFDLERAALKASREAHEAELVSYQSEQASKVATFQAQRTEREAFITQEKAAYLKQVSEHDIQDIFISAREEHEAQLTSIEEEYDKNVSALEARREAIELKRQKRAEKEEDFIAYQEKREAELVEIQTKLQAEQIKRYERRQKVEESRLQRQRKEINEIERYIVEAESKTEDIPLQLIDEVENNNDKRVEETGNIKKFGFFNKDRFNQKKKDKLAKKEAIEKEKEIKRIAKASRKTNDYFDYLGQYGKYFDELTGLSDLESIIFGYRLDLEDQPRTVVLECRRILELALSGWLKRVDTEPESTLSDNIRLAFKGKLISRSLSNKLHAIRKKGNDSAHGTSSISVKEAQDSLVKLDEFLRYYAAKNLDSTIIPTIKIKKPMLMEIQEQSRDYGMKTYEDDLTTFENESEDILLQQLEEEIPLQVVQMEEFQTLQDTFDQMVQDGIETIKINIENDEEGEHA